MLVFSRYVNQDLVVSDHNGNELARIRVLEIRGQRAFLGALPGPMRVDRAEVFEKRKQQTELKRAALAAE